MTEEQQVLKLREMLSKEDKPLVREGITPTEAGVVRLDTPKAPFEQPTNEVSTDISSYPVVWFNLGAVYEHLNVKESFVRDFIDTTADGAGVEIITVKLPFTLGGGWLGYWNHLMQGVMAKDYENFATFLATIALKHPKKDEVWSISNQPMALYGTDKKPFILNMMYPTTSSRCMLPKACMSGAITFVDSVVHNARADSMVQFFMLMIIQHGSNRDMEAFFFVVGDDERIPAHDFPVIKPKMNAGSKKLYTVELEVVNANKVILDSAYLTINPHTGKMSLTKKTSGDTDIPADSLRTPKA